MRGGWLGPGGGERAACPTGQCPPAAGTKAPQQRGRWKLAPLTLGPEADSPGRVQEAPVPNAFSSQSRRLVPARRTEGGGEGSASLS